MKAFEWVPNDMLGPACSSLLHPAKKKAHEKGIKNEQKYVCLGRNLKKMKNKWKSW